MISWLKKYGLLYLWGIAVRICLITSVYQPFIEDRIEVATPVNSWKRVKEALYWNSKNVSVYDGDLFHEMPLNLKLYEALNSILQSYVYLVFVLFDVATAYVLNLVAKKHINSVFRKEYKDSSLKILITEKDCLDVPTYVTVAYLFNPFQILNCVGKTSTVFVNFLVGMFLHKCLNKQFIFSAFALAICVTQNLYLVVLTSPLFIQFLSLKRRKNQAYFSVFLIIAIWCILTYVSYSIFKNWNFLSNTYGFNLYVYDLRPNIGLFWYFLMETFDHFQPMFLCMLQVNVLLLYLFPLSFHLHNDMLLLNFSLLLVVCIFKPYPCLGDLGFVLSLLPCWKYLLNYTKYGFLVVCAFCFSVVLGPIFWHLWLYQGSANANFYFGLTLAFSSAQIVILVEILLAYILRKFRLNAVGTTFEKKYRKVILSF